MLFVAPLPVVPLLVAAGRLISDPPFKVGFRRSTMRVLTASGQSWHCIGPVIVLSVANLGALTLRDWPIFVLALAAQTAFDLAATVFRMIAMEDDLRELWRPLIWTIGIDSCLAVFGLTAVIATGGDLWGILLAAVPVALVALLAKDRQGLAESTEQLGEEVVTAREEARIDPLTGLGNRRAWYQAVESAHAKLGAEGSELIGGVLTADLNGLKRANDLHGHDFGDHLIVRMAELTVESLPDDAIICRMGGDEFTALLVRPSDQLDMSLLADQLRERIASIGPIDGFTLSAAIGTAICPPAPDLNAALRFADVEAYADKRSSGLARPPRSIPPQANRESATQDQNLPNEL